MADLLTTPCRPQGPELPNFQRKQILVQILPQLLLLFLEILNLGPQLLDLVLLQAELLHVAVIEVAGAVELGHVLPDAVLLLLDGQVVTYSHGPQVPVQMQWPGTGPKQVRLSFQPQSPNSTIVKDGPWAFFRLIDEGQLAAMGPERFQITFNVGGHSATFEIRAGSVLNPFSLKELHRFRCPGKIG